MTNRYDPSNPNHKVTCTRSACAELERPAHPAGLHLDQRSEFYDGPDALLDATSMYVRGSARKMIREAPALTPEVVDLVTYIDRLQDQVTHARVDRDRGIREAGARALDCEAHGERIKALESQVAGFDASAQRSEKGRLALLGFLSAIDKALSDGIPEGVTVEKLGEVLKDASGKAHAAHDRAWKH